MEPVRWELTIDLLWGKVVDDNASQLSLTLLLCLVYDFYAKAHLGYWSEWNSTLAARQEGKLSTLCLVSMPETK